MKRNLLALLFLTPYFVFAQNFDWLTSTGDIKDDFGQWVKTDINGNIYVAGVGQGTCVFDTTIISSINRFGFLAKYDSAGRNQWVTQLPLNPAYLYLINDFQVNTKGETYMAGEFSTNGNEFGFFIKADSLGNISIQQQQIPSLLQSMDFSSDGSYYLLSKTSSGITISKKATTDAPLWDMSIPTNVDYDDHPTLQVTSNGGFIISCLFPSSITITDRAAHSVTLNATQGILGTDRLLASFDSNGNLLWAKHYNHQWFTRKGAVDTATNDTYILANDKLLRYEHLLKFDAAGNQLWDNIIYTENPTNGVAWIPKMHFHNGQVYFIGSGYSQPLSNASWGAFVLKRFDPNGNLSGELLKPNQYDPFLGDITFKESTMFMVGGVVDGTWGNQVISAHGTNYPDFFLAKLPEASIPSVTTAIQQNTSASRIYIYPNPAQDELHISVSGHGIVTIRNIQGAVVSSTEVTEGMQSIQISTLPTGVYFLAYNNGESNWSTRFVKQ